ncbi:hypothetical protein CR513_50069, partial [Mucuna pruriens]
MTSTKSFQSKKTARSYVLNVRSLDESKLTAINLDSNNSSNLDEEKTNICFITNIDKTTSYIISKSKDSLSELYDFSVDDEEEISYDSLIQNFHMVPLEYKNYKKISLENEVIKKENEKLVIDIEILKINSSQTFDPDQMKHSYEVEKLKNEITYLKKDLANFVNGSFKINVLSKNRRHPIDKIGVEYDKMNDKKSKSSNSYTTSYNYCGKSRYLESECNDERK